jgi:microcystin degradation protein MlrC
MTKRVLLAGLSHETHTFVRSRTALADFTVRRGEELLTAEGDASTIAGSLQAARECSWEVLPAISMDATPSGTVDDEAVEAFLTGLREVAEREAARGIDGVCLNMHGAMVSETCRDVEGEMLRRIRGIPALAGVPICGALDLHGNYSAAMARYGTGLIAYRENPHTDSKETAIRAGRLLDRLMGTGERTVTVTEQPPIVWPPSGTGTADAPMRLLEARAREIEAQYPELAAVNVFAGFSFADVAEAGVSFSAVTVGDPERARALLREMSALAWEAREQGCRIGVELEVAIGQLARHCGGPVLLVEPADNIGGGAPGDLTIVLQALLEHRVRNAAVCINDPEAVQALWDLPPGARRRLAIGGKSGEIGAAPLALEVERIHRSDGRYELEDRHSHAAATGLRQEMGPCVVARADDVRILITSRKTAPWDLGQWRSQGIVPEALAAIGVKAAVAHRQAYDPIAGASYTLDTPGPCAENLRRLPYRNLRPGVWPVA